jgi:hypothetical protein
MVLTSFTTIETNNNTLLEEMLQVTIYEIEILEETAGHNMKLDIEYTGHNY